MDFVKTPYLPVKKPALAVGDVENNNIKIIKPYYAAILPDILRLHADLTFCYLGEGVAVCAPESFDYYSKAFSDIPLTIIKGEKSLDRHYPGDASYNVAIVGKKIFCKTAITDRRLLDTAEKLSYKIIDMNQGYGKCSVCPVSEKSAISADMSFYKKAEKEDIEVLLVTNETILLPGYSNGFFGGCAYMEDKNTLAVKGDLTRHPDYLKISDFLEKQGICIKNTEGPVCDFGSFIPIAE